MIAVLLNPGKIFVEVLYFCRHPLQWRLSFREKISNRAGQGGLLVPRLRRAAANPACSLAHNRGHSKECLTAQRKFVAYRNSVAQHNFVAWSRHLKILVSSFQE